MVISEQNKNTLLQIVLEKYNLSIEDVLELNEEMTKKAVIDNHVKTFSSIWQGKNGRWYTYLPDDTKTPNRKLIAKSTEEKLHDEIVTYYKQQNDSCNVINLETFYPEWLDYKKLHSNSASYMHRIDNDWNKYYLDTPIIKTPIKKLTPLQLDEWAHGLIKNYQMTKTQYYNMSIIIRQSLDLAVSKGIIEKNPFSEVQIKTKMFRSSRKKNDASQVFLIEEQPQIENLAENDFHESGYTACLAVALCFQIGVRIGELVALKWTDISEEKKNYLHIQRMETKKHAQMGDGSWKCAGYEVVDHVKSGAGNRNVYLTVKAFKLLDMVKAWNKENGYEKSEYIFVGKDGQRIHSKALDTRIRKYCRYIGISEKSMHKIRKTYISTLIDSRTVNLNTIRDLVGHEDERTTLKCYCFNRQTDSQTQESIERALSL